MTARHTITEIGRKEDGALAEAEGLPQVQDGDVLPPDLRAFYEGCGGLTLNKIRMQIVPPSRFLPVNELGDDTTSLYLLAERSDSKPGHLVAIDLRPDGCGRCFAGGAVVAPTFTAFLVRLARDGPFWD